jgi:RimJ/RimL family protein N-acetyltransferase
MKPPEALETARLRLRLPKMEDAPSIFETYAQDPEVTRYLVWRPHRSIEETHQFLKRCLSTWLDGTAFTWVITRSGDDRAVGMIELRVDGHKVDLGYVLAKPHWGKGYMPEAVRALIDWALAQPAIHRVWAVCDIENLASARVLEKVGMQREGVLRRWSVHPNVGDVPRDSYCYSIVKR